MRIEEERHLAAGHCRPDDRELRACNGRTDAGHQDRILRNDLERPFPAGLVLVLSTGFGWRWGTRVGPTHVPRFGRQRTDSCCPSAGLDEGMGAVWGRQR